MYLFYDSYKRIYVFVFFFFKQKTAYEMRISDWSSDVCSSDLQVEQGKNKHERQGIADENRFPAADPVGQPAEQEEPEKAEQCACADDQPRIGFIDPERALQEIERLELRRVPEARKSTRLNSSH